MQSRLIDPAKPIRYYSIYTQTRLNGQGGIEVSYPEDACEQEIISIAEEAMNLEPNQNRIPIFINIKDNSISFMPKDGQLKNFDIKSKKIQLQDRYVSSKIIAPKAEIEFTLDITSKISKIVGKFFDKEVASLKDYYTLFSLENPENPRPLDPRKPLFNCTLAFDRLVLKRYLWIFPPHLMTNVDSAWLMYSDCRSYIFEHEELDIPQSDLILLAVYDAYATDSESFDLGTFDLNNHIPKRYHFSYQLNSDVLEAAKTVMNKDFFSVLKSFVKIARKLHNFGITKYPILPTKKAATIDPYGLTFYNEQGEKIAGKILFPNLTEIQFDLNTLKLKYYNKNTRLIESLEFNMGGYCASFGMHLVYSIEILNKEIKLSQQLLDNSKQNEDPQQLGKKYHIEYKKLMRKLEFAEELAKKDIPLDEAYESIASFYGTKCEVSKGLKELNKLGTQIRTLSQKNNNPVLEDINSLKEKLTNVNNIFLDTREDMRNVYLNNQNHLKAYNECAAKVMKGVKTVGERWEHISTRGFEDERVAFASKILELLMFYWCEANFLDQLLGKLSIFEKMMKNYDVADVKKAVIELQIKIAIYKQQMEDSLGVEKSPMPARLSEPVFVD